MCFMLVYTIDVMLPFYHKWNMGKHDYDMSHDYVTVNF